MKTPCQTLRAAAEHMSRVGWIQGSAFADPQDLGNSSCCTIGAITKVAESEDEYRQARAVMTEYLLLKHGWRGSTANWNDRRATQEIALAAMRGAADMAEPQDFEPAHVVFPSQRDGA